MKKLWLHIGAHKTGSTAIQATLAHNTDSLAKAGILYPQTGRVNVAHHRLGWAISAIGPDLPAKALYAELDEEISKSRCHTTIISSETFFLRPDLQQLKELLSGYEVHIICYLRRQDVWLQAMYTQHIKDPLIRETELLESADSLDVIYEHLDYYAQLCAWKENLQPASMHIFPYDKSSVGEDVVEHFITALNLPRSNISRHTENAGEKNITITQDMLDLIRLSNAIPFEETGRYRLLYDLQTATTRYSKPKNAYNSLSPKQVTALLKEYQKSNEKLAHDFFIHNQKFDEKIDTSNTGWSDIDISSLAAISTSVFMQQYLRTKSLVWQGRQSHAFWQRITLAALEICAKVYKSLPFHKPMRMR